MTARAPALVAFAAVTVMLVGGCASNPDQLSDTPTASVTQTAPSLWDPLTPSAPNPTASVPDDSTGNPADAPDSTSLTLPGLTEECTRVIRAQNAVNRLFAAAMDATSDAPATPTSESANTATTATTPVDGALTEGDVTAVFSPLDGTLPSAVTAAFDTLHDAAQETVGHAAVDIAQILSEKDVTSAFSDIAAYVKTCVPPPEQSSG